MQGGGGIAIGRGNLDFQSWHLLPPKSLFFIERNFAMVESEQHHQPERHHMSPRITRLRPAVMGTALAAAALIVAGSYPGLALASPSAHKAPAAPKVGPGWSIAEYSAAQVPMKHEKKGKTTLYLVSPQGKKTAFFTFPASIPNLNTFNLVDWSGDGQRVLVQNAKNQFEQISVPGGKVVNRFTIPALDGVSAYSYTRPHGEAILTPNPDFTGVRRYDTSGHLQIVLSKTGNGAIDSPDGTSVIVGTKTGLEVISNSGGVVRKLKVPAGNSFCSPVRWWTSKTILAACSVKSPASIRLWLFPAKGGKVTALTPKRNPKGQDQGDIDAWKLSSGTYTQALGACGVEFVATLAGKQVKIPGDTSPSDHIVTGQGASLLVQPGEGCSEGAGLLWFNPRTKHVTWVLRAPKNIIGVEFTIPFGRPLS
jgi:hypothetical protein